MGHYGKETARIDENDVDTILRSNSHELQRGLDPLFERIGDARVVLLGEASHGTHEYYGSLSSQYMCGKLNISGSVRSTKNLRIFYSKQTRCEGYGINILMCCPCR